jgi:hypothetical protein
MCKSEDIFPEDVVGNLRKIIETDHEYAWSWHCNVAMASMDEGVPHDTAHMAAARFMKSVFGIDTTAFDEYQADPRCTA